jgi:predicted DNA-binding transcriptional regulator AlpA
MQTLLTQRQASEMLTLSQRSLERMRVAGDGPKFVRVRRCVRYRLTDVLEWIASRVRTSTSQEN